MIHYLHLSCIITLGLFTPCFTNYPYTYYFTYLFNSQIINMMRRFGLLKKAISSSPDKYLQRRCLSPPQAQLRAIENDGLVAKMPAFDYSPPVYTGPTADQILRKRKEYLSPSMFCFYKKPVSLIYSFLYVITCFLELCVCMFVFDVFYVDALWIVRFRIKGLFGT